MAVKKRNPVAAFKLWLKQRVVFKRKTSLHDTTIHGGSGTGTHLAEDGQLMPVLPEDIVFDIFSRLPINSLYQCRLVCKSWYSAIDSPRFSKLHSDRIVTSEDARTALSLLLIERSPNPYCCCRMFLLESGDDGGHSTIRDSDDNLVRVNNLNVTPVKTQFNRRISELDIAGSCNGLLCLSDPIENIPVYVVNPVTGAHVVLPAPTNYYRGRVRVSPVIMPGFGFDCKTGEFKVIFVSHWPSFEENQPLRLAAQVFTINGSDSSEADSWRRVGNVGCPLRGHNYPIFVSGALHWLTDNYRDSKSNELIVSFEIGRETFQALPAPKEYRPGTAMRWSAEWLDLTVIGGCLSVVDKRFCDRLLIWVMKEYGDGDSWVKHVVLKSPLMKLDWLYVKALGLIGNGDILVLGDLKGLILYDFATKRFKKLKVHGISTPLVTHYHFGSLISPKVKFH